MDKKNVINSLSSTRKRKPSKKLVDSIRKEAFQNAYPDQKEGVTIIEAEKPDSSSKEVKEEAAPEPEKKEGQQALVTQEQAKRADREVNHSLDEREESVIKPVVTKSKRGRKKKVTAESPNEFTTLNCTTNTLNRAKISSALTNTPMYQFVDEAIDNYIRHLKKSGKITLDI